MKVSHLLLRRKCPTNGARPTPTVPCGRLLLWLLVHRSGQAAVALYYFAMSIEKIYFMKKYVSINI